MPFDLSSYEPVEDRIRAFWQDHPTGRIETDLWSAKDGLYIVQAIVYRDPDAQAAAAMGWAMERETERGVNATSPLENCETSAIGRALANLGYAAKGKRPSREEMRKTSVSAPRGSVAAAAVEGRQAQGDVGADTPSDGGGIDGLATAPPSSPTHAEKWTPYGNPEKCAHQLVPGIKGWLKCTKCGRADKEAAWA